jgi:hypothetical protein
MNAKSAMDPVRPITIQRKLERSHAALPEAPRLSGCQMIVENVVEVTVTKTIAASVSAPAKSHSKPVKLER